MDTIEQCFCPWSTHFLFSHALFSVHCTYYIFLLLQYWIMPHTIDAFQTQPTKKTIFNNNNEWSISLNAYCLHSNLIYLYFVLPHKPCCCWLRISILLRNKYLDHSSKVFRQMEEILHCWFFIEFVLGVNSSQSAIIIIN